MWKYLYVYRPIAFKPSEKSDQLIYGNTELYEQ